MFLGNGRQTGETTVGTPEENGVHDAGNNGREHQDASWIHNRRCQLEFPKFAGQGLRDWLYKCDRRIEVEDIAEDSKVKMDS